MKLPKKTWISRTRGKSCCSGALAAHGSSRAPCSRGSSAPAPASAPGPSSPCCRHGVIERPRAPCPAGCEDSQPLVRIWGWEWGWQPRGSREGSVLTGLWCNVELLVQGGPRHTGRPQLLRSVKGGISHCWKCLLYNYKGAANHSRKRCPADPEQPQAQTQHQH